MALITCKECGGKVSDKAKVCPHCGCPITKEEDNKIFCQECGAEIQKGENVCQKCGCPIDGRKKEINLQKEEQPEIKEDVEEQISVGGDGSKIPDKLNKFNWGAFGAWPFWGFANGMPWLLFIAICVAIICLCVNLVSFDSIYNVFSYLVTGVIVTIFCIIFGSIGSGRAWKLKQWNSEDDFVHSQREWMGWGIVCYVLFFIAIVISMTMNPVGKMAGYNAVANDSIKVGDSTVYDDPNDNPQESLATNAARANSNGFDYDGSSVTYIHGKFTGLHGRECLALCPMKKSDEESGVTLEEKCIVLFYKDTKDWIQESVVGMATDVVVQDLDNDSLMEIVCTNEQQATDGSAWRGVTVYKLRDNNLTVIYNTPGLAKNWNASIVGSGDESPIIGQEVSRVADVDFVDENGDGVKELKETIKTKVVKGLTFDADSVSSTPQYTEKTKTRTLRLRGGRYK